MFVILSGVWRIRATSAVEGPAVARFIVIPEGNLLLPFARHSERSSESPAFVFASEIGSGLSPDNQTPP
jgi:hypothetical protein